MSRASVIFMTLTILWCGRVLPVSSAEHPHQASDHPGHASSSSFKPSAFRLLGTVIRNDQAEAVVIEDAATGNRRIYHVGESLYGGLLRTVERGRILVEADGQLYTIELPEGAVLNPSPALQVDRAEAASPRDTSFPIDAAAHGEGGIPLTRGAAHVLRKLGRVRHGRLKPGDVILTVNGRPVSDLTTLRTQITAPAQRRPITELQILHHGTPRTILLQTSRMRRAEATSPARGAP